MALADCLRNRLWSNCASLAPLCHWSRSCHSSLRRELTYALGRWPHAGRLCGQEKGLFARLWLQITPQGFIAEKGSRDQDLRLRAQSGGERREEVSRGRVENCRQQSGYQLSRAKHVHAVKSRRNIKHRSTKTGRARSYRGVSI